jgi:DNA polymerase-3 subunit beta
VAENDAKPIHTGTLFELTDDCIRLVSVDGYRLAVREEKIASPKETSFVVPGKTLSELLKLLKDDGEETIIMHIASRHIVFEMGSYTIVSRLLEGEFLDYHSALPKQKTTEMIVNVRDFVNSVERVSLLITDRLKSPIRCEFENNEIKLFCSTPIGRANDRFPAKIEGQNMEMGFNNRYLLDALRNSECDEVKICLSGAISPMLIMPRDGDDFLFLVLPVRLKSDY